MMRAAICVHINIKKYVVCRSIIFVSQKMKERERESVCVSVRVRQSEIYTYGILLCL